MAERNDGAGWKALPHAVRIGHEALELFGTGTIAFPLPNAAHILDVKPGRLPYASVAEEIEGLLERVEAARAASVLPDSPDEGFIEAIVHEAYRREVCG